jgi:membrane protein DedA with SNARE-associated domain
LLVALETVVPPIPSELVLGLAGLRVAHGELAYPLVLVAATAGAVTGATLLDAMGSLFGERRLYGHVRRNGRFVLIDEQDLRRAFDWFTRHAALAAFGCRVNPGLRSLISFPTAFYECR